MTNATQGSGSSLGESSANRFPSQVGRYVAGLGSNTASRVFLRLEPDPYAVKLVIGFHFRRSKNLKCQAGFGNVGATYAR